MFDNSQEYITMNLKKTLQANTGIYPPQYMAPTNLQQNKQQAKPANCATKKKIKKITQQNHH